MGLAPASAASRAARAAGCQASSIVLSPISARPRPCTPAAADGADSTCPMRARRGRASYLGARSVSHCDPGARSTALILGAAVLAAGGGAAR